MLGDLQARLVKLFWRIAEPGHPRGRVETVLDADGPDCWRCETRGMTVLGFPELEMTGIPRDQTIAGHVHGVLFEIMGYMAGARKEGRKISADEHLGGYLAGGEQDVLQHLTFRATGEADRLRIVDYDAPATDGFPKRLMASYIACTAKGAPTPDRALPLVDLAIDIWQPEAPYTAEPVGEDDFDPMLNQNNYYPFQVKAVIQEALGEEAAARDALLEAVARCPQWAATYKPFVLDEMAADEAFAATALAAVWKDLDPWAVQAARRVS